MTLRTNYNDGGETQLPTNVTAADMNAISAAANAATAGLVGVATVPSAGLVKSTGTALAVAASGTDYMRAHWVNVLDKGADPTGTADSTSAFTAALSALPSTGGVVYAPSGTYKISSTVTFLANQLLRGDGENATALNYTGTGACLTTSNPAGATDTDSMVKTWAFEDFCIDGTSAGTGAMGILLTNLFNLTIRGVQVRRFQTTGAIAIGYQAGIDAAGFQGWQLWNFDAVNLLHNTTALDFNGAGIGTGQGGYAKFDVYIEAGSNQNGVTSRNISFNTTAQWKIRGFFGATGTTNTGWVFAVDPGDSSGTSFWDSCSWDIVVTLSRPPGGPLYPSHQTIVMGSASNRVTGFGVMDFYNWAFSGIYRQGASIATGALFSVAGRVSDAVLGQLARGYDCGSFDGGTQWSVYGSNTFTPGSGNNILPGRADVWEMLLGNGNTTIPAFSNAPFARARKMEFIIHQPASGAAGAITWPSNVEWVGGNGGLSGANGAVDKVRLTYMPSTDTWYGEVDRHFSTTASQLPLLLFGGTYWLSLFANASASATQTLTLPATTTDTLVSRTSTDTLTNKTLTTPMIASIVAGGFTQTLPTTTNDTLCGIAAAQTLTSKTLTSPTINGYVEGVQAVGTVTTSKTLPALSGGTLMTALLTAASTCVFTMPTAVAGASFTLKLQQASTPTGLATFTGVLWPGSVAYVATSTASFYDILTFMCFDGTHWNGSYQTGFSA